MQPITFKEQTCVYAENQPEYLPLPVYKAENGDVISCWQFTWQERLKVLWTGKMWFMARTFNRPLQPQLPSVHSFFEEGAQCDDCNG